MRTIAVHSQADADALFVQMADEAWEIGPAPAAESYLRIDKVIDVALKSGAQCIHPGYGFLSERAEFAEACAENGIAFIGPPASAIKAMGLKDAAKALAQKAGVPVVPGYHGSRQEPDFLRQKAYEIGYPVLIKAVAGGGGKGMKRVDKATEFDDALASAMREAQASFGDPRVLVEKYVLSPRHVEIQIFADQHGNVVHLNERDCSLQRRHQKVVEEAPAPGMTPDMRAAMGKAAVEAARAVGYVGAGTVEFIADGREGLRPDRFYFMEMNTRLQVEHPVTEAITGVDLVEWQLRVASGEPLPAAQSDLSITGHAIEARLYAEDAAAGFLPATGRLEHLHFGEGARADTGVGPGDEISPWYDPMIAKLIVHGPTRGVALRRMDRALATTEVAGATTNLAFLRRLVNHPRFAAGDVDTGLIEADLDTLVAPPETPPAVIARAALAAMGLDGDPAPLAGFSLWAPLGQVIRLAQGDDVFEVRVALEGAGRTRCSFGEELVVLTREAAGWRPEGGGQTLRAVTTPRRVVVYDGDAHVFDVLDPLAIAAEAGAGGNRIEAPMPGLVKAVFVAAGDRVERGARLAVLEAMKMEHVLTSGRDGVVAEVLAAEGAQVEAGAPLILLETEEVAA